MKRAIRNYFILFLPFLLMIAINEIIRPTIKEKPYSKYGRMAMNSAVENPDKCTWTCHNNTRYCKENHVKYLIPYYEDTDRFYFGLISMLKMTGNYGMANVVFLVIIFPAVIWFLVVRSLRIQEKLKK